MRILKTPVMLLVMIILLIILVPASVFAAPSEDPAADAAKPASTVKIYHTNDVHGNADATPDSVGYARLQTYIKQDEEMCIRDSFDAVLHFDKVVIGNDIPDYDDHNDRRNNSDQYP